MTRGIKRRNTTLADGLKISMRMADGVKDGSSIAAYSDALSLRKKMFRTGLFEVDLNLRPVFGAKIQLLGSAHVGKSILSYIMLGAAHRTCRQCITPIIDFVHDWTGEIATTCKCGKNDPMRGLLIDAENSFDPPWANRWGVNIPPNFDYKNGDQATEIEENVFLTKDATFAMVRGADATQTRIVAENMIRDGSIDFMVVDSLASLMPTGRRSGKEQPGDQAKAITQFTLAIGAAQGEAANLDGVAPTILMINQKRVKIGGMARMGMTPMQAAGGEALKYNNTMTWDLKTKYDDYEASTAGRNFGDSIITATKDKESGATMSSAEYRFYVNSITQKGVNFESGDTDAGAKVYKFLKELGNQDVRWFQKKGAKYVIFGREFTKVTDIAAFLGRRDVGHLLSLPIYAQKFPATLRAHLGVENYNYTPFKDDPILEMYETAEKLVGANVSERKRESAPVMLGKKTRAGSRGKPTLKEDVSQQIEDEFKE